MNKVRLSSKIAENFYSWRLLSFYLSFFILFTRKHPTIKYFQQVSFFTMISELVIIKTFLNGPIKGLKDLKTVQRLLPRFNIFSICQNIFSELKI